MKQQMSGTVLFGIPVLKGKPKPRAFKETLLCVSSVFASSNPGPHDGEPGE